MSGPRSVRQLPETSELLTFVVAAESESLSQAARRLHLSPQAVAKRLRKLESVLEERLLSRGPRGATLTPRGRALYGRAIRIVDEVEALLPHRQETGGWSRFDRLVGRTSPAVVGDLEAILEGVLAAVPDGVALVRAADGSLVAVNGALVEIVGWSPSDLMNARLVRVNGSLAELHNTVTDAVCVLAVRESAFEAAGQRLRLLYVARTARVAA